MAKGGKIALIAGASGLVGTHLLNLLLEEKAYEKVVALVRKPLEHSHPKLEQIETDFSDLSQFDFKVNHLYISLGTTMKKAGSRRAFMKVDLELPYRIALHFHEKGAKKLAIISSMGADIDSGFFYSRTKGKMEERITGIPFKTIYFVRPSLLLGKRQEFRFAEKIGEFLVRLLRPLMIGKLKNYRGIQAKTVASGMVNGILRGKKGVNYIESADIPQLAENGKSNT